MTEEIVQKQKIARRGISLPVDIENLIVVVLTPPGSTTSTRTSGFSSFISEAVQGRLESIFKKDILTILETFRENPEADFVTLSQLLAKAD